MKSTLAFAAGIAGVAAQMEPNVNTATASSAVFAAQATAATYSGSKPYVPGLVFDRYIQIWLENTDYTKAVGDPNLAWLATQGILLENYFGVTHPSQPNYVASVGGDNLGMDNDNFNQVAPNVSTVVDLLEDKGISWGSYQQDMPYTGYEGFSWVNEQTQANDYVRKHNPPVIYDTNTTPQRLSYQKNLTEFATDLANEELPQWSFITPNMTNDGHDTSVTVAGQWTRSFLQPLLQNEYFMNRTLILVTFDETHTYTIGNRVMGILLGGAVPKKLVNTTDSHFYCHYSNLATVEANWGLHTLGRWDVGANVFKFVAENTGDVLDTWSAATGATPSAFLNSSFAGPFNTEFQWGPYPIPNVNIVSRHTKRTVLPSIVSQYENITNQTSYYKPVVAIPDGLRPPKGYAVNNVNNA